MAATLLMKSIAAMKSLTVQERAIRRASGSRVQPSRLRTIASACSRERGGVAPSPRRQRFLVSSSWVGALMDWLLSSGGAARARRGRLAEALDLAGESPRGDVGDIGRDRGGDLRAELGVLPDELGAEQLDEAEHVVDDQDL